MAVGAISHIATHLTSQVGAIGARPVTVIFETVPVPNIRDRAPQIRVLGLGAALSFPIQWVQATRRVFEALRTGDRETLIDAAVAVWHIPVGLTAVFENIVNLVSAVVHPLLVLVSNPNVAADFTSVMSSLILKPLFVSCGVVFTAIEIILEGARLVRTHLFRSKLNVQEVLSMVNTLEFTSVRSLDSRRKLLVDLETNREKWTSRLGEELYTNLTIALNTTLNEGKQPDHIHKLTRLLIQGRLTIVSSALNTWYEEYRPTPNRPAYQLAYRVGTVASKTLLKRFQDSPYHEFSKPLGQRPALQRDTTVRLGEIANTIEQGVALLRDIDSQATKVTLVYALGFIALSLVLLAFILSTLGYPPLLLLPLTVATITLGFMRSSAFAAFVDQRGWRWNWQACIPQFLRRIPSEQEGVSAGRRRREIDRISDLGNDEAQEMIPLVRV